MAFHFGTRGLLLPGAERQTDVNVRNLPPRSMFKMNPVRAFALVLALLGPLLGGAHDCRADTIITANTSDGAPGIPINSLELSELGINPADFLFTANTMYEVFGQNELNIIAAAVDPGETLTLNGIPITSITITVGDPDPDTNSLTSSSGVTGVSGEDLAAPEPPTWALLATACFLALIFRVQPYGMRLCRVANSACSSSNWRTDSSSARRFSPGTASSTSRGYKAARLLRSVFRF